MSPDSTIAWFIISMFFVIIAKIIATINQTWKDMNDYEKEYEND